MKKWDKYFLDICNVIASNSKCLSRQIGAILVRDNSVVCTGYNGPPRGVPHCGMERYKTDPLLKDQFNDHEDIGGTCPRQLMGYRSGEGIEICIAGHAERNALINAGREGVVTKGCVMYMDCPTPCSPCLIEIINAGIKEIVITKEYYYDPTAEFILKNSSLKWRIYNENKK